ncbi:MAG: hypothetical protein CVV47_03365 [Spirochaetae bacterium HGW-Spirochaetae-3]|nr:MAG: hypothetical protein CVV47_03365 [Spirochaetae bacterium HGW-Spirochaetae-3]
MKTKPSLVEHKVDTKLIIMATWIAMMCLYLYCDICSLFRPGQIDSMVKGKMGFLDVSQMSLFWAGVLMAIPALMILVSPFAAAKTSRIINLIVSPIYFLVNIGNLLGETWGYYYLFGLLELGMVAFIFIISLRWPRQAQCGMVSG